VEWVEVCCGCETNNKYKIRSGTGMDVYTAKEQNDCCTRICCGVKRPFDMTIMDNSGQEVTLLLIVIPEMQFIP
jgi:hypothetical protein